MRSYSLDNLGNSVFRASERVLHFPSRRFIISDFLEWSPAQLGEHSVAQVHTTSSFDIHVSLPTLSMWAIAENAKGVLNAAFAEGVDESGVLHFWNPRSTNFPRDKECGADVDEEAGRKQERC